MSVPTCSGSRWALKDLRVPLSLCSGSLVGLGPLPCTWCHQIRYRRYLRTNSSRIWAIYTCIPTELNLGCSFLNYVYIINNHEGQGPARLVHIHMYTAGQVCVICYMQFHTQRGTAKITYNFVQGHVYTRILSACSIPSYRVNYLSISDC